MSLILEALRKSEAERQRDGTPNVAMELPPVPVRGNGATPGWVWPTLAVVVIGAILAGWLGMRAGKRDHEANRAPNAAAVEAPAPESSPEPAVAPTMATTPAAAPTPAPAPVLAPAPSPAPSIAIDTTHADGMRSSEPPVPAPPAPTPAQAQTRPLPPPPAPPVAPVVRPPAAAVSADTTEDAPPIASTGLPAVKLSMHMWDADPAKRFVIIDGQRMGEGDRSGGLAVIAIRRDGVIVERNGLRAKVPLP